MSAIFVQASAIELAHIAERSRKCQEIKLVLIAEPKPILSKDTTKNWEWGQNDEKSVRMSGLIDLVGFSVQTTDATEKSVEARVSLLSRYSFRWRGGLKSPWGNGCKLSKYSVSGGKIRVISDVACGKRTKKTWSGCDCADVLRFAYSLSALHGIILQTKTM